MLSMTKSRFFVIECKLFLVNLYIFNTTGFSNHSSASIYIKFQMIQKTQVKCKKCYLKMKRYFKREIISSPKDSENHQINKAGLEYIFFNC